MRDPLVFLDGRLQPRSRARVSVRDRSFRYGEGVFETLRARRDRAFRAQAHLERLRSSAAGLGWDLPWPDEEIGRALVETLRANGWDESRARIHASPGPGGLDASEGPPTLLVEAEPFDPVPDALRRSGVQLRVSSYRRCRASVAPGAKISSRLENLLARRAARAVGAQDALLLNEDGEVCEASSANLFAVRGGRLWTPPLESGVLAGITRAVILDGVRSAGAPPVVEAPMRLDDLFAAEEISLSSTSIEVLPVVRIEDSAVGRGTPGPVTRELARVYRRTLDEELGSASR